MKAKVVRGKAGAPVVDTEVLKEKHGAPIIERRLFQPGTAVEIGRDAGIQAALEGMRRIEVHQHLVRDLGVARLVGSHQTQSIAAQDRGKTIKKKKDGEGKKDGGFAEDGPSAACASAGLRIDQEPTVPRDFPSLPILRGPFLRKRATARCFQTWFPN